MKVGSLFAGIGGFDLGFERAGMETLWQCEIDEKCGQVLRHHFPNAQRFYDVRALGPSHTPVPDVVCGGFPCQDLSVAGKREGLAGARSGLWFEFHRVLRELRPQWCVVENVPGLLSSHRGADFQVVIEGLVELGYCVAWRVLDAQYFGLAQRRKRVFVVGSLGDGRCAEVLFEPEGLRWNPPPRREAREGVAGTLGGGAQGRGRRDNPDSSGAFVAETLNSNPHNRSASNGPIVPALQAGTPTYERGDGSLFLAVSDGAIARPVTATSFKRHDEDTDTIIPFDTTQITSAQNRNNPRAGAMDRPLSAAAHAPSIIGALRVGGHEQGAGSSYDNTPTVGVRRLTPRECERLQGFPDDWTAGHADSHRYRMLGNAVAVPVAEWIGRRIMLLTAPPKA